MPLLLLETPPQIDLEGLPSFPFPPRPSFLDDYVRSTHYVPAAFPRSTPDTLPTPPPRWSADREEYKALVRKTTEEVITKRMDFVRGNLNSDSSRKLLHSCVTRFVKKDLEEAGNKPGLTLFVSHATGFGKEVSILRSCRLVEIYHLTSRVQIWEPAIYKLIETYKRSAATYNIDEIWLWETVNHGESCLVNAPSLGGLCSDFFCCTMSMLIYE